jgi:hypothetical protein
MTSKMERSSFLCMELFQKYKRRLRGSCAVTGGSDYLTTKFGANITGGKNARNAGTHFRIGDNETLCVTYDLCGQKAGGGFISHVDEKPVYGQMAFLSGLQFLNRQTCQLVFTVQTAHNAAAQDLDLVAIGVKLILINLVPAEFIAAMDKIELSHNLCKIKRLFQRRITTAYNRHGLIAKEIAVADGAIGNAMAAQPIFALKPKRLVVRSGTDNDRLADVIHAASAHSKTPSRTGYGFNRGSFPVNIKAGQVRFKKIRQLVTLDALGKTGIVFPWPQFAESDPPLPVARA